jgi:hypothetical protein
VPKTRVAHNGHKEKHPPQAYLLTPPQSVRTSRAWRSPRAHRRCRRGTRATSISAVAARKLRPDLSLYITVQKATFANSSVPYTRIRFVRQRATEDLTREHAPPSRRAERHDKTMGLRLRWKRHPWHAGPPEWGKLRFCPLTSSILFPVRARTHRQRDERCVWAILSWTHFATGSYRKDSASLAYKWTKRTVADTTTPRGAASVAAMDDTDAIPDWARHANIRFNRPMLVRFKRVSQESIC